LASKTSHHRLLVGTHYLLSLVALAQVASAYQGGASALDGAALAGTMAFSLVFSDFFSGVFHWSVDNYGDGSTPLLGGVIAAFQGHHDAPWTITHRGFANNVHKITKITIPAMLALVVLGHAGEHPLLGLFATLFFNLQVLSQEFHKLSHLSKPPRWAAALQSVGLIISRKEHGQHHSSPFESNYCILTGMCNKWLDDSGFFRRLERLVYDATGAVPNCWTFGPEGQQIRALALTGSGGVLDQQQREQAAEAEGEQR
jgi:palmitoyl-[glycerolipid] 3-(E)-desaturase